MPFILFIALLLFTSCGSGGGYSNHRSYIISDIGLEEELYVDDEE